ncbi:MAG: MarR family transcriptional regulator [Chloroflexota bacterium]
MAKTQLLKEAIQLQRQVGRELREQVPDAWMELSLTIAQLKSLVFIAREESTNFRQLATALEVTPACVTGIIERLVEQGLVSRTENPEDRRMLLLRVTGKGQKLLTGLREKQISRISEIMEHLSHDDLAALVKGLSALHEACRRYRSPAAGEA